MYGELRRVVLREHVIMKGREGADDEDMTVARWRREDRHESVLRFAHVVSV